MGTPQPLNLSKIGIIRGGGEYNQQDSIVFDKYTEHLTDRSRSNNRSNHRQPIVPSELKSGIWISNDHN